MQAGYVLLTGATGLLGRYLMRDLLLRDQRVAVLVRPNRQSAHERIDGVLAAWEEELGRALPRPVVLEGDISQPHVGLSAEARAWLGRNCDRVLHSAASLTFYEKDGEPWRSNVEGVRQMLDVCRQAGIRIFHHVSSSYVCGQRTGIVREDELDVGQTFGNDYERSKVQAEMLVRDADFLDAYTILRPSIIVGDSRTGFSSTFHGFYTPLRLICAMLTQVSYEALFAIDFLDWLGLQGNESKNCVPVDWVSQAMLTLLERQPADNRAYAFVTPQPVSTARMLEAFKRLARQQKAPTAPTGTPEAILAGPNGVVEAYREQLRVYQAYWRNDPVFDASNTNAVIPDLPCPVLTDEMMDMLARVSVDQRFAWCAPASKGKQPDARGWMRHLANGAGELGDGSCGGSNEAFVMSISGVGGGAWTIAPADAPHADVGRAECRNQVRMNSTTFTRLVEGRMTAEQAAEDGRLVVMGGEPVWDRLQQTLQHLRKSRS